MALKTGDYEHQRLLPRTLEDLLIGWVARLTGVVMLIVCGLTWLALISWSATDPSLSTSSSSATTNLLGAFGAGISDLLLQTLGLTTVFALTCLVVWGLQLTLSGRVDRFQVRAFLAVISLLTIAGGASALPTVGNWKFLHGFGGLLGDVSYNIVAGLMAQLSVAGGGLVAGLLLFFVGFWSFSVAIGLDRERLFLIIRPQRRTRETERRAAPKGLVERLQENADTAANEPQAGPRLEPKFNLSNLNPAQARLVEFGSVGGQAATDTMQDLALDGDEQGFGNGEAGETDATGWKDFGDDHGEDHSVARMAERFAPGGKRPLRGGEDSLQGRLAVAQHDADVPPALMPHEEQLAVAMPVSRRKAIYRRPSLNELAPNDPAPALKAERLAELRDQAMQLTDVLADFRVKGDIRNIHPGPVVTLFEFEPARGTKSSRIIALADDIARSMSAASARVSVMAGRNAIGIELPNAERETVLLRELLESEAYRNSDARLPLAIGKGIAGEPVVADLARMPHLLVAGTTGSGKSVAINAMILSLLYRKAPSECRLLMIDPKMLELSAYNNIPHLLAPVITDPQQSVLALQWAVGEMEERYKRMTELGVRSIDVFNNRLRHAQRAGEPLVQKVHVGFDPLSGEARFEDKFLDLSPMPHIVIIVDEFADLMCVAGKEIEAAVQRLAQMARAAGIHMIMATQRPSVDVVTGTIKANFPTRIGFKVASKIDSRTILNEAGAEQLLGQGDMLLATGGSPMVRAHGPFVGDDEVEAVSSTLKLQGPPAYAADLCTLLEGVQLDDGGTHADPDDALYARAIELVTREGRASTSYLQRRLSIGYNRAASLIERLEDEGVISPADRAGRRKIVA